MDLNGQSARYRLHGSVVYNRKLYKKEYDNRPESKILARKAHLLRQYNLNYSTYLDLLNKQNNLCSICKQEKQLYVDHNHETGEVRGLLCHKCNSGIGMLEDNPELTQRATEYLKGL